MTPTVPLSLEEFRHLVECYGAEPARWPASRREEARALLAASPQAQQYLAAEQRLDDALGALQLPEPSARLRAHIATIPLRHPQRSLRWRFWPFETWHPALALAAAAGFGLLLGWGLPSANEGGITSTTLPDVATTAPALNAAAEGDEEWEQELDLAFGNYLADTTDG